MKSLLFITASPLSSFHYVLAGGSAELVHQVKAVCLYNFAKFVDWPAESFAADEATLNICVLNDPPLAKILEARKDLKAKQRKIELRQLTSSTLSTELPLCHIFYWDSRIDALPASALTVLKSNPVLSVSEESSKDTTGLVQFRLIEDRVKFSIDHTRAEQQGLALSPQLLKLAVRDEG